jgi:hypothetical protein
MKLEVMFLLGRYSYVTLPCVNAPPAIVRQLDVFLLQSQFVNVQLYLCINSGLNTNKPNWSLFPCFCLFFSILLLLLFVFGAGSVI